MSATYTTAQGNVRSLTQWARPVIKPVPSWILVLFITHWATTRTPCFHVWTVMNNTLWTFAFAWMYVFSYQGGIPRSVTAGPYDALCSTIWRTARLFSSGCAILHSHQRDMRVPISPHPGQPCPCACPRCLTTSNTFSCAHWSSLHPIRRNVYLNPLPIFLNGLLDFLLSLWSLCSCSLGLWEFCIYSTHRPHMRSANIFHFVLMFHFLDNGPWYTKGFLVGFFFFFFFFFVCVLFYFFFFFFFFCVFCLFFFFYFCFCDRVRFNSSTLFFSCPGFWCHI